MMDFVKKNRGVIIVALLLLLIIIIGLQVKETFFPDASKAAYGDRLKGISKVKIDNAKIAKVIKNLKSDGVVSDATMRLSGKIIEVIITVKDDTSVDSAKPLCNKLLEMFSDSEKNFYDFQVFIQKKNNGSNFPIIGYKHHANQDFSFTKDRS